MGESRTKKSIRNSVVAFGGQLLYTIVSFICRTVFIHTLGKTYLGFNGLFNDILTLLSLAELGVGSAILYSMYKPVADGDQRAVVALLNLYRKVYNVIGIVITIIGLSLTPFLGYFISDIPDLTELPLIYLLYLLNTSSSYFFVYKKSILITDQKSNIASIVFIIATLTQNLLQIIFLFATHNFIIYLIVQIVCTIANNVAISVYVDRNYAYLKKYKHAQVALQTRKQIYANVKAMFVSKLSSAIVTSTDNLLISKFVSTVVLGLYSNYTLFTAMMRTIVNKIFEALIGSVGNLVATETSDRIYAVFKKIWFINFWIVGFPCAALFVLINPFIELWVGETYLLGQDVVFITCVNLFMRLIRNTFLIFTDTYGLFIELRAKCIAEAVINLMVSLIFVLPLKMGIYGVLLGTFISNITTNFWYEPYLLFVKKFNVNINEYFHIFLKYVIVLLAGSFLAYVACRGIPNLGWVSFFIKVIACCVIINVLIIAVYHNTEEYRFFKNIIKKKLSR